jgi:hypothetical protein
MRGDRRWAKRDAARSGGDGAGCRARPGHVRGRGGPSPLRRAPRLHRCPDAKAWNGFFKWASIRGTTCRHTANFMRAYAREATHGDMPRRLHGFRCRIRYWRNEDGDIYASRHKCVRRREVIRFYGMV